MNRKFIYILAAMTLFFSACGTQPYLKENSVFILFKTPLFKYADMGFLYENSSEVKVEIYGSGQALMSLKISSDLVCMNRFECMSKQSFNRQILCDAYPKNILDSIFRGKVVFNGRNIVKNRNGFTQKIIKKNKYNIEYSVLNREIIFSDTINKCKSICGFY